MSFDRHRLVTSAEHSGCRRERRLAALSLAASSLAPPALAALSVAALSLGALTLASVAACGPDREHVPRPERQAELLLPEAAWIVEGTVPLDAWEDTMPHGAWEGRTPRAGTAGALEEGRLGTPNKTARTTLAYIFGLMGAGNIGSACANSSECQSGHCTDGVCCTSACTGVCRACNLAGTVGICTYLASGFDPEGECNICQVCNGTGFCADAAAGTDPKDECTQDPASTCGQDGECDGAGACRLWTAGTLCRAAYCFGSTLFHADLCYGSGVCFDGGQTDCTPYGCSDTTCRTSCTLGSHCAAGYYCSIGYCLPYTQPVEPCYFPTECGSGYCVDGYCCNSECAGACRACGLVGYGGTCTYYFLGLDPENECDPCRVCSGFGDCMNAAAGSDPKNDCGPCSVCDGAGACDIHYPEGFDPKGECGPCKVCNGFGACSDAVAGTDPKDDCPQEDELTCGREGSCDGAGVCRLWPSGTLCGAESCTGAVHHRADQCDGLGICLDGGATECSPYQCRGSLCGATCSADADCVAGYQCSGNTCTARRAIGEPCSEAAGCQSGHCVDGVCCESACGGGREDDCEACSVAAGGSADGACLPLSDGASCDDGDACTVEDRCLGGLCKGGTPLRCDPPGDCLWASCDPASGNCDATALPDGTSCPQGLCEAGACVPPDEGSGSEPKAGCGCGQWAGSPATLVWLVLLLFATRMRRRDS